MTDHVNVVVKPGYRVYHTPDKDEVVSTPADGVVKMSTKDYAEHGPDGMNAVRKATKDDKNKGATAPAAPSYSADEIASFEPKHRGGGRWDVVSGEVVINGNHESRAHAEAWIQEQSDLLENAG